LGTSSSYILPSLSDPPKSGGDTVSTNFAIRGNDIGAFLLASAALIVVGGGASDDVTSSSSSPPLEHDDLPEE
jgi:hypothetical protein